MKGSKKLYLLVVVMSVFIVGVGWYGTHELKTINQHTQKLYLDRVLPLQQLTTIRFSYIQGILSVGHQLKNHTITIHEAEHQIEQTRDKIASNWSIYKLTYLTAQEKEEVQQTEALMQESESFIENFQVEMLKSNGQLTDSVANQKLFNSVNAVIGKLSKLIELQVKVGEEIRKESVEQYNIASRRFYILIVFSLIAAISLSLYIIGSIQKLIKDLKISNNKITEIGERYRSLLEHAGDPIFLLNEDTTFNDVNKSTCNLLGYSEEKLKLMKIADIFAPGELERLPIQLHSLHENKILLTERKWRKRDGTDIDIEVNVRLLADEKKYLCIARDITERKKIEEKVKESEKKYRTIFENAQDVFYQTSIDGIILDVSPSLKNHLGYKREELIGKSVSTIYADIAKREQLVQTLKQRGEFKEYEMTFKSNLGKDVFISLDARLIYDNHGKPSHIDGMFRNITERKLMLAQLVENQEQLTLFIEHSPVSLAMFDTEMKYIATSRRWILDYKLEDKQLYGKTQSEIFPEMNERLKDKYQRCLNGSIEKMEEDSFIKADGSKEWLRWEIHPWHKATGEIGGIIMFTEIITERKRATEMFRYQFENSPDIILVVNKFFKIELINRSIPGGTPVEELVGMDCIEVLPEESQELTRQTLRRCFSEGINLEIEIALRFGIWARSRFVPIVTEGVVSHVMIFSTDNTIRKKAELELASILQELENRVQERTKELFEKNRNILDSIKYAKRIQVGLLTPPSTLKMIFPKSFMISIPCDIVSGDFFWSHKNGVKKFIIVADCTGHGVPGALMSVICNNLMEQVIVHEGIEDPSKILEALDARLKQAVKGDEGEVKDGMDLVLCVVDEQLQEISFTGANNSLYLSSQKQIVEEIHLSRVAIGGTLQEVKKHFETQKIKYFSGQRIYLSSDGFYSQFGGIKGKKFMKSHFTDTLTSLQSNSIEKQKQLLMEAFLEWKGNNQQVDDVLVVGIEL